MTRLVTLSRAKRPESCSHIPRASITRSVPYAESERGSYCHRVRTATVYTVCGKSHIAINCWCGMTVFAAPRRGRFVAQPSHGRPLCATCEGRAIGAGTDADHKINGRIVRYAPRTP